MSGDLLIKELFRGALYDLSDRIRRTADDFK